MIVVRPVDETLREKAFTSVTFDEYTSIVKVQSVRKVICKNDLLPINTPLAVWWAHWKGRRWWFNVRRILRRRILLCRPWRSKRSERDRKTIRTHVLRNNNQKSDHCLEREQKPQDRPNHGGTDSDTPVAVFQCCASARQDIRMRWGVFWPAWRHIDPVLFGHSLPHTHYYCGSTLCAVCGFTKLKPILTHADHASPFELRKLLLWHYEFWTRYIDHWIKVYRKQYTDFNACVLSFTCVCHTEVLRMLLSPERRDSFVIIIICIL